MRPCILNHPGCEVMTAGSIGAAGTPVPMICQPCRDHEDAIYSFAASSESRVIDLVTDTLNLATSPIQRTETTA